MFLKIGPVVAAVPLASCVVVLFPLLCVDAERVRHHQEAPSTTATTGGEPRNRPLLPVGRQGGTEHHLLHVRQLDMFEVDEVDIEKVTAEDKYLDDLGIPHPYRFAIPNEVDVTSQTHGAWEQSINEDNSTTLVWRFRFRSRNAVSLNLGFDRLVMPEGGSLHLYDPYSEETLGRPYTSEDNADHGELWTAILRSEEAVLEVDLPPGIPPDALELSLAKINVGYRGPVPHMTLLPVRPRPLVSSAFGGSRRILNEGTNSGRDDVTRALSGPCNVDVVCPEGDGWRDEIRSVAVYSKSGSLSCTGFMVNNVNMDQTPLFMTADHCDVDSSNAASLVVYWNYETSSCGGTPDGSLAHSQSGATFRASYAQSDMTLVELNSLPDPSWNVTYAGWDARDITSYVGGVVAIHHPSVDEKRISYEYNATTTTAYFGTAVPGDETHIRVIDWDVGTTEGGSSGSPLFDATTNRVVGQLHGGNARCGTDASDWYGRFYVSWNGGGTDSTRLRNWLDPKSSGTLFVDTYDPSIPMPRILCVPSIGSIAQGEAAQSVCTVSSQADFSGEVVMSTSGLPTGIQATFFPSNVSVPSGGEVTSTMDISVENIVPVMSSPGYIFNVEATYEGSEVETQVAGVIVVTQGQEGDAVYDSKLGAPHCWMVGTLCNSSDLLEGRGMMTAGAETNAPNTLDSCSDGDSGFYTSDESMERLVVRSVGNGNMVEGAEVEIEAHVYAYFNGVNDRADFYYASDATDPTWVHIGTVTPPGGNNQVLTQTYFLPAGHLQAVRVGYRYMGSQTPCPDGEYDEADDLAFAVGEAPSSAPSTPPSWGPSVSLSPSESQSAEPSGQPSLSLSPSVAQSAAPSSSQMPSSDLSSSPSVVPSESPSVTPSGQPSLSLSPTEEHSAAPSSSKMPSSDPSSSPSVVPSESLSLSPSGQPSLSLSPSEAHSSAPTSSTVPSSSPSSVPSAEPSPGPSPVPSPVASADQSSKPSADPSMSPSVTSSSTPSAVLSSSPSEGPSQVASSDPSAVSSAVPSSSPSVTSSSTPSEGPSVSGQPTAVASVQPSTSPSFTPGPSTQPIIDLWVFRCRIKNSTNEVLVTARLTENIENVPMTFSWSSNSTSGTNIYETNKKGRARQWLKYENGTRIVATDPMTSTVELVSINGTDYLPLINGEPATETCIVDIFN